MLKEYPHILGYIGLEEGDVGKFLAQYPIYIKYKMTSEIVQILPCIVSNSREIIGIPEIVLHPLHLRRLESLDLRRENGNKSVRNIKRHRARYNFTPLLYITKNDIYSLQDLTSENIKKIQVVDVNSYISNNGLFDNLNKVMTNLLSKGYMIDGTLYLASLCKKTGFYRIYSPINTTNKKQDTSVLKVFHPDTMETELFPLTYSLPDTMSKKEMLRMASSDEGLPTNERALNSFGASLSPEYIFNKGNWSKKYRVDTVFPRPELGSYTIGKRPSRHTRKRRASI